MSRDKLNTELNNYMSSPVISRPSLSKDYFPETNIEIERYLHFDTLKGSRRGSRNSSSASATSMRSTRSLQQHHKAPEQHTNGHHTVVTNPNQLFSVNQQQHMQHQLTMHQQQQGGNHQRRRSSIHQSVVQHAPPAPHHHNSSHHHHHQQPQQQHEQEEEQPQNITQDVKVEITEVKP
jgi:hypothetical protein